MSRIYYKNYRGITLMARKLRKDSTFSEKVLWKVLRGKKLDGYKFLRQHPLFYRIDKEWVEFYIADFYCSELKLVIELDGPIHEFQVEEDRERDAKLKERGFIVKRIKNEEVSDINNVIESIRVTIKSCLLQISKNK
jgi:very-short-patch-repair endonuclease